MKPPGGLRRHSSVAFASESPPDLDDDEVLKALRGAHQAVHALLQESLGDFGLIPTEYRALAHLARRGELTPTTLSAALEITPASTTGVVDRLEARGLVRRRPNPTDRRSMLVALTPHGRSAYHAARTVYRWSIARVSRRMTKTGRRELVRGVGEFVRVFRAASASTTAPGPVGRRKTRRATGPIPRRARESKRGEAVRPLAGQSARA